MPTPHGLPATRPPEIDEAILGAVTCGLLEGRRLDVAYGSRAQGETMRCELTPLGLVFKGALAYLVCTFWDYPDVRQVALHRVHRAEVLEVPASVPEGFDLDRDIQQEEFSYPLGEPICLEAVFSDGAAFHLHDTPVSTDQVIVELDHERALVRATVENMAELRDPHVDGMGHRFARA